MTALEELIHELEETIRIHGDDSLNGLLAIERARELLTKEKEQREELIKEVAIECLDLQLNEVEETYKKFGCEEIAEQYYNQVIKPKYKL